jgi:hypothetical protein
LQEYSVHWKVQIYFSFSFFFFFLTCMVWHISSHCLQNVMSRITLSESFTWGFMRMVHHGQHHCLPQLSVKVNIFCEKLEVSCLVYLWQNTLFCFNFFTFLTRLY